MAVRERERTGTLADISVLFRLLVTYRIPMMINKAIVFERWPVDDIYYRCPRGQELLEREFMCYCSNCGQCLDWCNYRKVKRMHQNPR